MVKEFTKRNIGNLSNLLNIEAPQEKRFLLNDGRKLGTIKELQNALGNMDNAVFYHHVNFHKNDFSTWIRDVFNETPLAENVAKMENRFNMKKTIAKYISEGKENTNYSRDWQV